MRFSLRWIFVLVGLIAVVLASWFYHRPLAAEVDFKLAEVSSETVNWLRSAVPSSQTKTSDFAWFILNDQELEKVTQNGGEPFTVLNEGADKVSDWHTQSEIHTFHMNLIGSLLDEKLIVNSLGGGLSGFFGSRYAGIQPQLLIDCEIDYTGPSQSSSSADAKCSYHGRLFYKGERPHGHLLFLVPVEEGCFHVVIFDVK